MLRIKIKGKQKQIPTCFDDLSKKQLKVYLDFYYTKLQQLFGKNEAGETIVVDDEQYSITLLALLYSTLHLPKKMFFKIPPDELTRLIKDEKLIDFYFTGQQLVKNKYYTVRWWFSKLQGPVKFNQLSFEEFGYAEAYYHLYKTNDDTIALNMFLATLYRQSNGKKQITADVDCRVSFEAQTLEKALPVVSKLNHYTKLCIVLWYEHGRNYLSTHFNRVFDNSKNTQPAKPFDALGWEKVVQRLTNNNPAQFSIVSTLSVYRVFSTLQAIIIENEELERKMKQK